MDIKYIKQIPLNPQIAQRAYILKVSRRYVAVYPTMAGPKIKPEKPKVVKLETVKEIGSVVTTNA